MKKSTKILIIILCLIILGLITFIIVDKAINKRGEISYLNVNEAENNNTRNDNTQSEDNNLAINGQKPPIKNTEKNIDDTTESKNSDSEAIKAIKSALKDKNWIQDNIMIDSDILNNTDQELTFMCLKKESDGTPIIILHNLGNLSVYTKSILVSYENGKVITEVICEGPMKGLEVDPNNRILKVVHAHMGVTESSYSKVVNKKTSFLESFGEPYIDEPSVKYWHGNKNDEVEEISKEEYKNLIKKYENYNFVSIDTKLTDENIDKYIK